jgi:chromosome segregation ATPase
MSVKTAPEEVVNEGSKSDFLSLEEKVYRTIELLKNAREAKAAAERDAARVREQLELREEELETAKAELIAIKREREEVKGRVEKMLSQIDNIVAEQAAD